MKTVAKTNNPCQKYQMLPNYHGISRRDKHFSFFFLLFFFFLVGKLIKQNLWLGLPQILPNNIKYK